MGFGFYGGIIIVIVVVVIFYCLTPGERQAVQRRSRASRRVVWGVPRYSNSYTMYM